MKKELLLGRIEHYKETIKIKERLLKRTTDKENKKEYEKEIKKYNKKIKEWKKEIGE